MIPEKNQLFLSQRRDALCAQNSNLNTETDEALIKIKKNIHKRQTMVEDITSKVVLLKRCVQKFRQVAHVFFDSFQFITKLKDLNHSNLQERQLLGDLASSLENKNFYNLNGKFEPNSNVYRKQTLFDLTVGIMRRLKQQKSLPLSDKLTQLLLTTIDPIHPFMYVWNLINILIIFFFFFTLFIEEAFTDSFLQFECRYLREFNLLALITLFLDFIFMFNVKILVRGELMHNKQEIIFHYLQNGFLYDLLALLGFFYRCQDKVFNLECQTDGLTKTRQLIKYLFLFKTKRLLQLMKFFDYKFAFSPRSKRIMSLFRLFVYLLLVAHIFACVWIAFGKWSQEIYNSCWLENFEQLGLSPFDLYLKAFYFASMTMTTVGYGDIVPTNRLEYVLCIIMMIISSPIFGYTLNTVTNILQDIYNENEVYNAEVLTLAKYMRKKNISLALQDRVLDYLQCMQDAGLNDDQQEEARILGKLSQSLREGLLQQEKGPMLQGSTAITEGFRDVFINKLFELAQEVRFQPGEIVKPQTKSYHYINDSFIYVVRGQLDFYYENKMNKNDLKHQVKLFQLKTGERSGILNIFGKQSQNDYSIISEDFTVLYIIKLQDVLNLIYSSQFINSEERINYCQLQDKIRLYNDYNGFLLKCKICSQNGHEFQDCKNFFYQPIKSLAIAKQNFSAFQARKLIERSEKKLIHINRFAPFPRKKIGIKKIQDPLKKNVGQIMGNKIQQDHDAISYLVGEASNIRLLNYTNFDDQQDHDEAQDEFIIYENEEQKDAKYEMKTYDKNNQIVGSTFDPIQKIRISNTPEINLKNLYLSNINNKRNHSDIYDQFKINPSQVYQRKIKRDRSQVIILDSFNSCQEDPKQKFEEIKQYQNYFNSNNAQVVIRKYNMLNEIRQKFMKTKKKNQTVQSKFKSKFNSKKQS